MSKYLRKLLVVPVLALALSAQPQQAAAVPPECPYDLQPCPEGLYSCCCWGFAGCLDTAQECWTYCRYIPGGD